MNQITTTQATMSSREIAKLTGSKHPAVRKSAERLAADQILTSPLATFDYQHRGNTYQEYRFDKRDSLVLVARLSPQFTAAVIDRWQHLEEKHNKDLSRQASRQTARLEAPFLTDAVKHSRESSGKDIRPYHFSNEFDLINRIALGKTAKQYRMEHGIKPGQPVRDTLTAAEMACVEHLQRVNASLIDVGVDYEERKQKLSKIYIQRHATKLIAEIQESEA